MLLRYLPSPEGVCQALLCYCVRLGWVFGQGCSTRSWLLLYCSPKGLPRKLLGIFFSLNGVVSSPAHGTPRHHDSPSHLPKSKTNAIIGKKKETGAETTGLCAKVSHLFSELGEKKVGKTSLVYFFPLEKDRHSIFKEKACCDLLILQNLLF